MIDLGGDGLSLELLLDAALFGCDFGRDLA